MDLGDILDAIFRLYRNNFLTFIGIVALIQVPLILLQIGTTLLFNQQISTDLMSLVREVPAFDPEVDSFAELPIGNLLTFYSIFILFTLLQSVIVQQIINGALANAISQRYHEQPVSILSAYGFGINRMVSLVLAGIVIAVIMGIVSFLIFGAFATGFILFVTLGTAQGEGGAVIMSLLGMFLLIAGMLLTILIIVVLAVLFLFVTQAIVLEGYGPLAAIRRSTRLIRGSFWRVVGIVILLYILVQILTLLPTFALGGAIGLAFADPIQDFAMRQSLTSLVGYLAQILVLPLLLIGYTLLYYDLRVRKEGYDIELQTVDSEQGIG